jgi:Arc/MetJ family transcription regulator
VSDVATTYMDQHLADKKSLWLASYENFGTLGDVEMARVTTLHISEVAARLDVDEQLLAKWLRRYELDFTRTSYGIRVPLLTYPILAELAKGKSIDEARKSVADVNERLGERP